MASFGFISPALACAENISLLHLLHSVPSLPASNSFKNLPIQQDDYALPFDVERRLAGVLAFLSNAKNDPNHVTALCLREDSKSSSMDVLLAVNRLQADDGDLILEELGHGFEKIFKLLSQLSAECSITIERNVFAAILSMCSHRILGRLRFVANSRGQLQQPLKEVLQLTLDSLRQSGQNRSNRGCPLLTSFVEKSKEVMKLTDAWAKHQTTARLEELVDGVHRLRQVGDVKALLDTIPNKFMDPSSRANLYNIISKVARYREAARFLVRTARRFHLVRQMKVVLVKLPEKFFCRAPATQHIPKLATTISRIERGHRHRNVSLVCRLMNTTRENAENQFVKQTKRTLTQAKIHAEIQILLYCETKSIGPFPRVVCSSKDACFLCNSFIHMHGKMHIPRYHGRLYPGWRLPLIPECILLYEKFNRLLEAQVRDSLEFLLSRGQRTVYPDPNESTLLTLPHSASTLLNNTSVVGGKVGEEKKEEEEEEEEEEGEGEEEEQVHPTNNISEEDNRVIASKVSAFSILSKNTSSVRSVTEMNIECIEAAHVKPLFMPTEVQQSLLDLHTTPKCTKKRARSEWELAQGRVFSSHVTAERGSTYTTGVFEIHIDHLINDRPSPFENNRSLAGYSVEWLTVEEAKRVRKRAVAPVIDVEALQGEVSCKIDDEKCILMSARGAIVRIALDTHRA